MALKDQSKFSGAGVAAPNLNNIDFTPTNTLNNLNRMQDRRFDEEKLMLAQANADRNFDLKNQAAIRQQAEYDFLNKQRDAMANAATLQTNVTDGQAGQQAFENQINAQVAAQPGVKDYNTQIKQLQSELTVAKPGPTTSIADRREYAEEQTAYNKAVDFLRSQSQYDTTAVDPLLQAASQEYTDVNKASGYDGLKLQKADVGYEDRVYKDLIANGVDPVKAAAQARTQAAMFEPVPLTKAQLAQQKASLGIIKDNLKNRLDIIKNENAKGKVARGGYTRKTTSGKSKINSAVTDLGFQTSFLSSGDSKSSVIQIAKQISIENAPSGITEADVADALYMKTEGEANAWLALDPSVAKDALRKEAATIAKQRKGLGDAYSQSTYDKYGPNYSKSAYEAVDKANAERAAILGANQTVDRNDTGLKDLLAQTKVPSNKPKQSGNTTKTNKTSKTKKDALRSSFEKAGVDKKSDKVITDVTKATTKVVQSPEGKKVGLTEAKVNEWVAKYEKVKADPNSTPGEIRGALIEKYGAKFSAAVVNGLGNVLKIGGDVATAIINDDRAQTDQKVAPTRDELLRGTKDLITGDLPRQKKRTKAEINNQLLNEHNAKPGTKLKKVLDARRRENYEISKTVDNKPTKTKRDVVAEKAVVNKIMKTTNTTEADKLNDIRNNLGISVSEARKVLKKYKDAEKRRAKYN